jgi:hypothetical protein
MAASDQTWARLSLNERKVFPKLSRVGFCDAAASRSPCLGVRFGRLKTKMVRTDRETRTASDAGRRTLVPAAALHIG